MNLTEATDTNLRYILKELAAHLQVVNHSIMDPEDYDLDKYDDLKMLYDIVKHKGQLSVSETQAFAEIRK